MPTKKPRLLVTLEPENHQALRMLAIYRRKSASAVINELLEPVLKPLVQTLGSLIKDPNQTDLLAQLEALQGRAEVTLGEFEAIGRESAER